MRRYLLGFQPAPSHCLSSRKRNRLIQKANNHKELSHTPDENVDPKPNPWAAEHHPVGQENISVFFFCQLRTILIRTVKVNALIYEIIVAEINAIKYFIRS